MRKAIFIVAALLIGCSLQSSAQKLEENKVDDFTKNTVKRTTWENLFTTMTANAYFRISSVSGDATFDLKYQNGSVIIVNKDQQLMFKMDNGDIIKLSSPDMVLSCNGCGARGLIGSTAEGIQVSYPIDKNTLAKLKAGKVVKVRFETKDGYIENDIKGKNAEKILTCLNLI